MESGTKMRRFIVVRKEDETGISGTGHVAEGVVFWDGTCVIKWTTDTSSIGIYKSHVEMIHLHGHEGRTVIEWIDGKEDKKRDSEPPPALSNEASAENTTKALEKVAEVLSEVSEKLDKKVTAED